MAEKKPQPVTHQLEYKSFVILKSMVFMAMQKLREDDEELEMGLYFAWEDFEKEVKQKQLSN